MAGDWIKMRVDLGDDPAVIQIAASLDISEDEVVGKLHRLWAWADRHTTDGTAPAITAKWVDRYVSMSGFAEAMVGAGWISFSDAGVAFPGFERHNGESAKRRVEATLRQRLSRKNRDDGVTGDARTPIPRPFVRHVMTRDNYTCVYCGVQSSAEREAGKRKLLSVDHIKPIARGGSAAVENLACCCKQCNSEKADRTPEEWGLLPGFLQAGVEYQDGLLVSQKNCDSSVTREEKRREESKEQDLLSSADDEPGQKITYSAIADLYNRVCGDVLPRCVALNKKRKTNIRNLCNLTINGCKPFRELDFWEGYFNDCLTNRHWTGDNDRGWRADLEFLTRQEVALKALEAA